MRPRHWLHTIPPRLRRLFRRRKANQELDEELRDHIEEKAAEYVAMGMAPMAGRRRALVELGGVEQVKEQVRANWTGAWLDTVVQDAQFGVRMLRKSPGFAITTILTLALGIAGSVAIFGFVDAALIQPLPYPNPSRLMGVFKTSPLGGQQLGYSYPDYLDLERSNTVFASIAAYEEGDFVLSEAGSAHLVNGFGVTGGFFRILGVAPILGRDFVAHPADEDLVAEPSTVILSYAAWQRWFDGRPDVLGKAVTLSGSSYTVIGVLPRSFQFAPTGATEFWTTLHPFAGDGCQLSRGCMAMGVIARPKNGITIEQVLADIQGIAALEAREHPDPD
ncbi:MAG: ABC transporter permease, partial [Bryobacteraceae bacterium]